MLQQPLFRFLFVLIIFIALLHIAALELYFYWTLSWFDVLVHFLAGLWVGLGALWLVFLSGYITRFRLSYHSALFTAFIPIVVLGIGWELFEVWAGIPIEEKYLSDTVVDLSMDILGALSGYIYVIFTYIQPTT